jgi:hypothetical protein
VVGLAASCMNVCRCHGVYHICAPSLWGNHGMEVVRPGGSSPALQQHRVHIGRRMCVRVWCILPCVYAAQTHLGPECCHVSRQ